MFTKNGRKKVTFTRTVIPDVIVCEPIIHGDERGYFVETFRQDKLEDFLGYKINFLQDNESKSSYGVLRGLHYQLEPFAQTKLIRVIQGTILDVALDIRRNSPTFGLHVSVQLSGEDKQQMFIPKGFAHGFVVLSDEATVSYKVDNYYAPQCDRGIAYNDPLLKIDWLVPQSQHKISTKDTQHPYFKLAELF